MPKRSEKSKKRGKGRDRDPARPPEEGAAMTTETAPAAHHRHLRDGTAAIPPVTDAMLAHAAHEAAVLAEGVAHGTPGPHGPSTARIAETTAEIPATPEPDTGAPAATAAGRADVPAVDAPQEAATPAVPGPAADALSRYNGKLLDVMRANAASTASLFAALIQARSIPEALSLNAEHLRRQVETLTGQGRELAELAQRVALDALQPFKGSDGR